MLRIYTKTGATRAEISPSDGSTETTQLQGDAVLSLSFTTFHSITFDVNDYDEHSLIVLLILKVLFLFL